VVAAGPGRGDGEGLWVASAGRVAERRGLTWVAADLSADTTIEGWGALGFPCVDGRRLIASGPSLWLACERGVVRIDAGGSRIKLFELDPPTALARAPDGVWVGNARGLFVVTNDGKVVRVGRAGAGVWLAATNGLAFWDIAHSTFRVLGVPLDVPSPVRDVAVDPPYLWVATDSGLVRFARDAALR